MTTPTRLRSDLANLVELAERDLDVVWQNTATRKQTRSALKDVLPPLLATYTMAATAIAADWYDEYRTDVGAPGSFTAVPAEVKPLGALQLADWATGYGNTAEAVKSLTVGGMTKRILNGSRDTIIDSTARDRSAQGWMRVGAGACDFCRMLIARGAVYTQRSAFFASHDKCKCQAAPKFPGAEPIDVDEFRRSTRNRTAETKAKDAARVRDWIKANPNAFPLDTF